MAQDKAADLEAALQKILDITQQVKPGTPGQPGARWARSKRRVSTRWASLTRGRTMNGDILTSGGMELAVVDQAPATVNPAVFYLAQLAASSRKT